MYCELEVSIAVGTATVDETGSENPGAQIQKLRGEKSIKINSNGLNNIVQRLNILVSEGNWWLLDQN